MTGTVIVACKMPNGVILDLDRYERIGTGDNFLVRTISGGKTVTLKGWAYEIGKPGVNAPTLHGGYRLNEVDADFWNEWYERNMDTSSLIKDRLIYCEAKRDGAEKRGVEQDSVPQQFAPARGDEVRGVQQGDREGRDVA